MKQQRGAVTLIGAMFLIFVMIVLLSAVQRMATTEITDTALQSDGVEALFLAETGLERAAWRYSTGSTCAALAGETGTAGRGNFEVLAAAINGSLCRVQVSGTIVTTTVANTVSRTIEGDLTASGGASIRGWAVGYDSGGIATLLAWDGSTWTQPGPYAGVPSRIYYGVSCVTASDCWAVGERDGSGGYENIIHWDGSTWTRTINYSGIPNDHLYAVYCLATDDCWAVGDVYSYELIIHWDGSTWTRTPNSSSVHNRSLYGIHCIAANDCWAVGELTGEDEDDSEAEDGDENINHWDGTSWTRSGPWSGVPYDNLYSVHCVSSNDCWTVGDSYSGDNLNHWNGSAWTRSGPWSGVPNLDLNGVSCVDSNSCWAVGDASSGESINHWDGSSWTRSGPYSSITDANLEAVDMVSATEGYTVGLNGTIANWDGSSWNGQTSPSSATLNAVSVISGGGSGGVSLVQWAEVIL